MKANTKRKICFLTTALDGGGAQRVLINIANSFANDGYVTHLICFVTRNSKPLYSPHPSIIIHYVPRGSAKGDKIAPNCKRLINALIKEINPDILIPFLMPVTAYAYKAAKKHKVKIIVSERNDPTITPANPFWKKQRDYIFPRADGCVFQTRDALQYFGENRIKKYAIIQNPINLSGARTDTVCAKNRTHRIVCVAKYEPQKNLEFLLEVFGAFVQKHPDYELEIYGNDYHKHRLTLRQKAIAMGLEDKVHLYKARPDIFDVIYDARMSVLPSKYEGMPNALIESVSLGVPSIASDCPAYGGRMVINSGENGFLIDVDDKDDFVEKMCLLAENDELADAFSTEGKKVKEKFDLDEVYKLWKAFVEELINS